MIILYLWVRFRLTSKHLTRCWIGFREKIFLRMIYKLFKTIIGISASRPNCYSRQTVILMTLTDDKDLFLIRQKFLFLRTAPMTYLILHSPSMRLSCFCLKWWRQTFWISIQVLMSFMSRQNFLLWRVPLKVSPSITDSTGWIRAVGSPPTTRKLGKPTKLIWSMCLSFSTAYSVNLATSTVMESKETLITGLSIRPT